MTERRQYLSLEQVADLLGVDYQLVYRLVRSNELPAVRLGRVYRVSQRDLDDFIEKRKTTSTQARYVCSACGTEYKSSNSLTESCAECGAPICFDCWRRVGRRYCTTHQEKEVEP